MTIRKPAKSVFDIEAEEKVDKRTEEKEFVVKRGPSGLYSIALTAGGEVPDILKGQFTTGSRAEAAAKEYLLRKHAAPAS